MRKTGSGSPTALRERSVSKPKTRTKTSPTSSKLMTWSSSPETMSRLDSFQDLADRKCQVTTIIIAISLVFWLSGVPIMRRYFGKTRIQELTCHSPLCVSLQDAMRDLLTTGVDPCEDFYTYVCGRWTRHATRYSSFHEDHRRAAKSAVHTHFMASHNPERERSVHASMSTLYRNCIDHVGKQKTVRQIMAEVLKALDIKVTSWRSMAIGELMPSLVELNLLYDMASLFWVRLTRNASLSIGLGQTIRNCSASAYSVDKLYIYVTSMIEAVTPGPWGDDMVQGVVELDDALHQATNTPDSSKLVPIGQLNLENVTAQTWMRSVNAIVPSPTGITSSAIVNTTGLSNLRRAFVIFSKASSYVRAMHLIIVLTSDVVRYEFYDRYFDADKLGHYVTCTELVSQFFHDDYPSLEASLLIKDNRESKAQLLFQRTKSSVMFELRGNSNVSVDETQIARTLIKKIALLTFSPFNEFKNATRVFSDDFIRDMFIVRRKLAEARIRLGTNFSDTAERLSAIQWTGGLTYVRSTNSVVVASQNLVPAYFYVRQDQEHFNYGILATQFAKELLEALPDHFSTNTSCGNTLDFKLRRFTHAQRVELLRLSQAARASYRMYRDHFGSRSAYTWEEQVAIDRLFFQRFCTMFCSHALLEHRPSFLRMRHRCQMPLESMPEFQHAYQCASKADQRLATKAMCPPVEPMSS